MSKFVVNAFEGRSICPKCKDLMRSDLDERFGSIFKCRSCNSQYWCISPGYTEREFTVCDDYTEAILELACIDDGK